MSLENQDLKEIRKLMERSTRFISLSGLSGILAGIYALVAIWLTRKYFLPMGATDLIAITALVVLGFSLATATLLSRRRAQRQGIQILNSTVQLLLFHLLTPLLVGGILSLILLEKNHVDLIAATQLIFYGLALINASKYTAQYVQTLGFIEIFIGLFAAYFTAYSLELWGLGFGVVHIVYSTIIYWKYER
jgi:hypothetical protein